MIRKNQSGVINLLVFPLVVAVLLLLGVGGFAVWAYQGRQDYKNNVDAKIAAANVKAVQAEDIKKDAQFAEEAKNPLKTYAGPEAYGAIRVMFPKTWSAYVDETGSGNGPVSGYFSPNVVPSITAQTSAFALRLQVLNQKYSDTMRSYANYISGNKGTLSAYSLPKIPDVVGSRLEGEVRQGKQGSMVILPLRDKTLEIWTEAPEFKNDFDKNILPNLTFSP